MVPLSLEPAAAETQPVASEPVRIPLAGQTDVANDSIAKLRLGCVFIAGPIAGLPLLLFLRAPAIVQAWEAGEGALAWTLGGLIGAVVGSVVSIIVGLMMIRKSGI